MNRPSVFVHVRVVSEEDLDELNHVNNLRYLHWTLKAAGAHSKHVGWPSDRYRQSGLGWIVRSHKITYKVPAQLGDHVLIRTWLEDLDRVSALRKYEILRQSDGRVFATAETRWVFVDLKTLKLTVIPDEIRIAFVGELLG
jgi:acyl-CoA thioester hydrolase